MNRITTEALGTIYRTHGIGFVTTHDGGGASHLVATLEGGAKLVLSDGNLGTDLGAFTPHGVDTLALLFAPGDWEDGGDPIREAFGQPVTAGDLFGMILKALG